MMDITDTLAPKSDQLNAEDLLAGPRTVTVEKVTKGSAEQPIEIHLAEFKGRPFKPSKTVRRLIVAAWGPDADAYARRRMTLYRDPAIKFGGDAVGGIRVSHLSHITRRVEVALTVTRGKRAMHVVEPLPDDVTPPHIADFEALIATAETVAALDELAQDLKAADLGEHRARMGALWKSRKAEIEAAPPEPDPDPDAALDAAREAEGADQ